jgi:hypothetical protein
MASTVLCRETAGKLLVTGGKVGWDATAKTPHRDERDHR